MQHYERFIPTDHGCGCNRCRLAHEERLLAKLDAEYARDDPALGTPRLVWDEKPTQSRSKFRQDATNVIRRATFRVVRC